MAWVETESLSFTARHESDDEAYAQRTLDRLEDLRLRLEERFDEAPGRGDRDRPPLAGLAQRRAPVPARRPACRGAGRTPLPRRLGDGRRSFTSSTTSTPTAARPARTPCRRCAGPRSASTRRSWSPPTTRGCHRRGARAVRPLPALGVADRGRRPVLRRSTGLFRAAANTRMRKGGPPSFPPSARDAIILGGTVFELLERERGPDACSAARLAPAARAAPSARSSSRSAPAIATSSASGDAT